MNVMGGVKATASGGYAPFVEVWLQSRTASVAANLSVAEARQVARRLHLAARAAEKIAQVEQ